MNFHDQLDSLQTSTWQALGLFRPELTVCVTIVVLLLARMIVGRAASAWMVALAGSAVAFAFAVADCMATGGEVSTPIFGGMLVFDKFTIYFRAFLMAFTLAFIVFTWRSGIPDRDDGPDFYTLSLGATLGMMLMASANHLLIVFLAVEMASVPSYALSGMLKGRRQASEAALKFSVYGAGAAGIMLYGISLLAGVTGTVHFPDMAAKLAEMFAAGVPFETQTVLALGGLMVMVGLAFKLSAVPFHFWAPDVFEGASAEIGGFLSVASKGAALALLVRIAVGVTYVPEPHESGEQIAVAGRANAVGEARESSRDERFVSLQEEGTEEPREAGKREAEPATADASAENPPPAEEAAAESAEDAHGDESSPSDAPPAEGAAHGGDAHARNNHNGDAAAISPREALAPVRTFIALLIGVLAAITATFGNLAAYGQTNIKRLLAYSTIAQAGYMMMPVAAAVALMNVSDDAAADAIGSMAFYVAVYLFMNLTAFMIVAFVRNKIHSEEISDYSGLLLRSPGIAICFSLILLSLLGLPPLAGLPAKVRAFGSLASAGMLALLIVGCLNALLSVFYYLRVVWLMAMGPAKPNPDGPEPLPIKLPLLSSVEGLCILVLTIPLIVFGVFWNPLNEWAVTAARGIFW